MSTETIAFIGGGNMAAALIGGLITDGTDPQTLTATDPDPAKREALSARFGIRTLQDNVAAAGEANVVVLAVKPQMLKSAATELAPLLSEHQPLIVSIAAGVRCDTLKDWLGGHADLALIRSMPNTPAMIQAGATVLYAADGVNETQRNTAEHILRAVGLTRWVDREELIDTVTAVSGSGPAYYFLVMEAMEQAAIELGLPADTAHLLTLQTALGAARMAMESPDDPATLRQKVTSPGGTTEQAIKCFEEGGLRALFKDALTAARDRSIELSKLLEKP